MHSRKYYGWAACGALALVAIAWSVRDSWLPRHEEPGTKRDPLTSQPSASDVPPIPSSRFLNTEHDAAYVGSQTCAACHEDEHQSYLLTAHSRALSEIVTNDEPADHTFFHQPSGRDYQVYRNDGEFRHRESLRTATGEKLLLADYAIRYVIGSGQYSRSYLAETDGFLLESPITWYATRNQWGMSPGYDRPVHAGFERVADLGCVYCHAGRAEAVDGNRFRINLLEQAIGCESCHGPGSLHVAKRRGEDETDDSVDLTIVHPGHLTREQNEAICAHCHLRGDATVAIRGRHTNDFRPGLRTADFRIDYALEQPGQEMKVVGHVEQMRLSRCYQESQSLVCTTCHDPHAKPLAESKVAYYRAKCVACHAVDACGLEQEQRRKLEKEDNCAACHMPQSPTDIPHFAFTHHRIDVHSAEKHVPASPANITGRLVPHHDLSHLPLIERERCLGLAYLELSEKQASDQSYHFYRNKAFQLLSSVYERGLRDVEVNATLARLYWEEGRLPEAIQFAQAADREESESGAVANALLVQGDAFLRLDQPARALAALQRLVKRRRNSQDWVLIAACQRRLGRIEAAIESLHAAIGVSPGRPDAAQMLAELYAGTGNRELAETWGKRAQQLKSLGPR